MMKHLRLLCWLWLSVLVAVPENLRAEDNFEPGLSAMCFMVTPKEPGCVHIKVMYLDQVSGKNGYIAKTDTYPDGAWVWADVGGRRHYIFSIYNQNDQSDTDDDYAEVYIRPAGPSENGNADNGVLVLTNDRNVTASTVDGVTYDGNFVKQGTICYKVKKPQGQGRCLAEFDWFYPTDLAGQSAKFVINGHVNWGRNLDNRELTGSPITLDKKPDLFISDPIFMPTGENTGYYNMVVSNTTGVKLRFKAVTELTEDGTEAKDITSECKTSEDGLSLLIPAISRARRVKVQAQTPYNAYRYIDLDEKVASLNAFHNAKEFDLQTSWGERGSTVLKWTVPNADQKDVLPADGIAVERRLYNTGEGDHREEVWELLDYVTMKQGQTDYEYRDDKPGCFGDSTHNSVQYRIYRMTVGAREGYMSRSDMPDKRSSIGQTEPPTINVEALTDGRVRVFWLPTDWKDDGIHTFMPEGSKSTLIRVASFYRNGMPETSLKTMDVSDMNSLRALDGELMANFYDEGFAPCTQYKYMLMVIPNDPTGVMKTIKTDYSQTVEPMTDQSGIHHFNASDNTYQDRIHLQWDFDVAQLDSIKLFKWKDSEWKPLEDMDPNLRYYDDYDVAAGQQTNYRLGVYFQCTDGPDSHLLTASGTRKASGRIAGFVTFSDGTGLADVTVQLVQEKDGKETVIETQKTKQSGAYLFPDVPYADVPYIVRISSTYTDFDRVQFPVYMSSTQSMFLNQNFVCGGSFDVAGHVYFEQTTVPVVGATFKVDGQTVFDKSGNPVMTGNDGAFSFKVVKGAKRIVALKDGHTFMHGGLYADNKGKAIEITEPKANIFFWDQTKVRTIGRVVGGRDQGEKPLGQGLSVNNLGDDLRIVLELEGNERSWLVKDQLDDALTVKHDTLTHEATANRLTNAVTTERHRVVISPNLTTGEYIADLLPVRYKVVEVSAKGYPSLFQKGEVAEVIDLTDSLATKTITADDKKISYRAIYNRIYRHEPTVSIAEVNPKTGEALPYVGEVAYQEPATSGGGNITVPLFDPQTQTYTFGYPVLAVGNHNFRITATEDYYYNGTSSGTLDQVPLRGGKVRIYDDFAAVQSDTLCVLGASTGSVDIKVDVANTVYDVTGDNALRHLDVTLEHNGQFIDGKSLRAFVMGYQKMTDDVVSADGIIQVEGVLRDPPGSRSYAWIDKQTTSNTSFNFAIGASLSLQLGVKNTTGSDFMSGAFAGTGGGTWIGTETLAQTVWEISPKTIPLVGFEITHQGSINFQLNERLQTSDDPKHVGAGADVFYGYELVAASSAVRNIRAINESTYRVLDEAGLFSETDGVCHLIAQGKGAAGLPYYLISDYNYMVGPKVKSNFVYTQDYILNTLLPKLKTMRNSYLYKGTRQQAQAEATASGRNVAFSLRQEDDPRYAQDNLDEDCDYISIDRYDEYRDRLNYELITPLYVDALGLRAQLAEDAAANDSIRILNRQIAQWEYIVLMNEMEKVEAINAIDALQKQRGDMEFDAGTPYNVTSTSDYYMENHTVTGGTTVSHSESFSQTDKLDYQIPILGWDVTQWNDDEQGMAYFNKIINGGLSVGTERINTSVASSDFVADWEKKWSGSTKPNVTVSYKKLNTTTNKVESHTESYGLLKRDEGMNNVNQLQSLLKNLQGATDINIQAGGNRTTMSIEPIFDATYESNNDDSTDETIVRGYQLQTDDDGHLSVDVYHDVQTVAASINVAGFTNTRRTLSQGNYIFRTIGGATKCPHEPAEHTKIYAPGTELSAATAQVEKPRIAVEKHVVSGVPYGEKAKFNLVLSNEGTVREEGSFDLVLLDQTNQAGATLMMDGAPLGSGRSVVVPYGTGMVKVLEIGAGIVDDYENIRLALRSQCDPSVADTVSLSVHFVPSASPIAVVTPQDKWVLNTNSARDNHGLYYMPVSIGGFDVNFRNFDHVELQYKQSSEPESRWTNLCSYYSTDSLYQQATGTKAMLTGNTISHAFYGASDPVELNYDLRAVTYSRLGNDFVTNASAVFSGIKDTRRPQVFGNPLPANGILGVADDLKLVFSEKINANRLLETNNFKVTGLPNSSDINTSTSIYLNGGENTYLESEAERNFAGESFSIDMMVKTDWTKHPQQNRGLFLHQTADGCSIDFSLLTTKQLQTIVKTASGSEVVFTSQSLADLNWNIFQRVVMVYDNKSNKIHFYVNNANVDNEADSDKMLSGDYMGNGKMRFGYQMEGNLLETRVWTKALSAADIAATEKKSLYGYEVDLCAYYPMNEGQGTELEDKAQGATLSMQGATWSMPEGRALKIGNKKMLLLKNSIFADLTAEKDYTLSFWFKTEDLSQDVVYPLLSPLPSGRSMPQELCIENGSVQLRKNNQVLIAAQGGYADNQWHQLTMVVNHTANLVSLYMDGDLSGQTAASNIGNWEGYIYVGARMKIDASGSSQGITLLKGYIDEITLWEMALPQNIIVQQMNESCDGTEVGLHAYIPFSEHVSQIAGGGTLMEFSTNYFSNKWDTEQQKFVAVKEEAFTAPENITNDLKSNSIYAPMKEKGKVKDLRFNFITKDNELLIELAEPAKDIERTMVHITAMGIEDLNGNEMAQPVQWAAFVHKNMVRWAEAKKTIELSEADNKDATFSIDISNKGGNYRSYTIEGMPNWMSIEEGTQGDLDPEETLTLHITVSKDINVNTYDQVLYLRNDEGLVDPLMLTIVKSGVAPQWAVNKNTMKNMQLCAQVQLGGKVVTDKTSQIAAFDESDTCLGLGTITTDQNGKSLLYMTIYGEKAGTNLYFRLWQRQTGITYSLTSSQQLTYTPDALIGTYQKPVVLNATQNITRTLTLEPSWTWVSINVMSDHVTDLNKLLRKGSNWTNGDQLKDPESQSFYHYDKGTWRYSEKNPEKESLRCDRMYYIKSQKPQVIQIDGRPLSSEEERTIHLHNGWNYIGYTPLINLPINEALTDFYSKATDGDIIKSQDEFATFSTAAGGWRGNLQYMKPGKGYMLYHKNPKGKENETVSFTYPYKTTDVVMGAPVRQAAMDHQPLMANTRQTTMNLIVRTEGIEAEEGDRLLAYSNGELRGISEAVAVDDKTIFFLSLGGEKGEDLTFTLERNGNLLGATSRAGIIYQADTLEGTTDVPKVISLNDAPDYEKDVWYALTGIKIGTRRPATPGVYIFNGQKVVIKN